MKTYKTLIDVREPWEYDNGNVSGSINIPLGDIQTSIDDIKKMNTPILICCQSGGRSGVATNFLQNEGVDCENGGGWQVVNNLLNNKEICLENS